MFEGWVADLLASSLGRFIDVQRDSLRISLWSGQGELQNVRIRAEAFEYLQLPFAVQNGCIGRLKIQIPWGRWRGGPLIVDLSDVTLTVACRDDTEWEEGPAARREQAAKQADLAAAELAKLGGRMAAGGSSSSSSSGGGGSWGRWRLLQLLTTFLLNNLQLTVSSVHLIFLVPSKGEQATPQASFGIRLKCLKTCSQAALSCPTPRPEASVAARIVRHITLQDCALYWADGPPPPRPPDLSAPASPTHLTKVGSSSKGSSSSMDTATGEDPPSGRDTGFWYWGGAGGGSTRRMRAMPGGSEAWEVVGSNALWEQEVAGLCYIMTPMDVGLRVAVRDTGSALPGGGGSGLRFEVAVGVQEVRLQLSSTQLAAAAHLADSISIWERRNRYGRLRPPGWRTVLQRQRSGVCSSPRRASNSAPVSWAQVWQYAARAVLADVRPLGSGCGLKGLPAFLSTRRRYIQLYRTKLELLRAGAGTVAPLEKGAQEEVAALEARLPTRDILVFRALAEAAAEQHLAASAEQEGSAQGEESRWHSWMAWGASGVWGFLSQAPGGFSAGSRGNGPLMEAPSEAAIRELYRLLGAPEHRGEGGGSSLDGSQMPSGVEVQGYFQVSSVCLSLREATSAPAAFRDVLLLQLHDATAAAFLDADNADVALQVDSLIAYDCTDAGVQECVLCRLPPAAASAAAGAAQAPPPVPGSSPLKRSMSFPPLLPSGHTITPAGAAGFLQGHRSQPVLQAQVRRVAQQPAVSVSVQPLQVVLQPRLAAALERVAAALPVDTLEAHLVGSIALMANHAGRTRAKAQLVRNKKHVLSASCYLAELLLTLPEQAGGARARATARLHGVRVSTEGAGGGVSSGEVVRVLEDCCSGRLRPAVVETALGDIESQILYHNLDVEVGGGAGGDGGGGDAAAAGAGEGEGVGAHQRGAPAPRRARAGGQGVAAGGRAAGPARSVAGGSPA